MRKILLVFHILLVCPLLASAQDITTGLTGYWPFSGDAQDAKPSGNLYHGTPMNGAALTVDRHNRPENAYIFDGIDDYIIVPDHVAPTTAFTYSIWFKPSIDVTTATVRQDLIIAAPGQSSRPQITLSFKFGEKSYPGQMLIGVKSTQNVDVEASTPTITAWSSNMWYHFVGSWDGHQLRSYVNGQLQATVPAEFTHVSQKGFSIGARKYPTETHFRGAIDDIRIYDRALDIKDIQALYQEVPLPVQPPVVVQWAGSSTTNQLIHRKGDVAIGVDSIPDGFQLAVKGKTIAEGYVARLSGDWKWADYVFDDTYALPSLQSVETFVRTQKHLPDVPSAQDVERDGISLEKMDGILLKKIEEITLYLIQLQKENEALKKQLKSTNEALNQVRQSKSIHPQIK